MRRIPIRTKLAAALAVPLVAMALVTLIEIANVSAEASDVSAQTDLATATIGPNGLITALQNERNFMAANAVGADSTLAMVATGYPETRAATDEALVEFEDNLSDAGRTAYAPAFDALEDIDTLRADIDTLVASAPPSFQNIDEVTVLFDEYTAIVEPFFGGMSRISIAMDDPELRQGATLMEAVSRQIETIPQLTNAIALPATVPTGDGDTMGINSPAEIAEVAELDDSFGRQAEILRTPGGAYADLAAEYYPEDFTANIEAQVDTAVSTGTVNLMEFIASLDVESLDQAYIGYQSELADMIQARADELNDAADSRQIRYIILMGLTFVAAVVLTIFVSLSITRPLRSLTRQAQDMAGRRLPDAVTTILDTPLGEDVHVPSVTPVRVSTRDEVADVAAALNTVQDSALDLAVEQAVLRRNIADSFVNLGRRNQNLLGRQLDFITELESSEADPDTLSSLFRLDHLATRMRRNAESLLVLAGIEPPRQWAAPVRLNDVIRAALGEVEDYQRVVVRAVEPATVVGSAAADLAHLLAELIENALVFSPPDRSVDVRGARNSRRHQGGYTLAVIDAGLGMSPTDIDAANRRLAGTESFTVAPSKYLGHYVAGNLAARHGIDVELQSSPGSGITALVELPAALLTANEQGGAAFGAPPGAGGVESRSPFSAGALATARPAEVGPPTRQLASPPVPSAPPAPAGLQFTRGPAPAPASSPGPAPGRPAVPAMPGPTSLTSGGLARRVPRDGGGHVPNGAGAMGPSDAQLASFARATGQRPEAPPLGGRGEGGTAPPLARRQRGAQLPTTDPISLRRRPAEPTGPARAPAGPPPAAAPPPSVGPPAAVSQAANEVYGFLSSFTAGVERGLQATRTDRRRPE